MKVRRCDIHGIRQPESSRVSEESAKCLPAPITVRIPQAIAMIGLSRSKLYEFIKAGDIEVIKVGRSTLIPVDSLQQFIAARRSR